MNEEGKLVFPKQLEGKDCLRYIKYGRTIRGITKKNYQNNVDRTNLLFNKIYALSQNAPECLFKFRLPNNELVTPEQIFISKKLTKLQSKYQGFYSDFYLAEASTLSQLICFIKDCKDSNTLVIFRCSEYRSFIDSKFNSSKERISLLHNILSLDNYALKIKDQTLYPQISEKQIHDGLVNFQTLIESKSDYCPYSEFDDIFYCYINSANLVPLFDEQVRNIVKELNKTIISKNNNSTNKFNIPPIDFSGVGFIYEGLKSLINPTNPLQETVMKYTVIRFFFDRLYLAFPYLNANVDKSQFYSRCIDIPQLDCASLKISDKILPPNSTNKKFIEISKYYKESLDLLSYIQFHTDPLTIAWLTAKSLHYIERATYESNGTVKRKKNELMAFDDIFSLFWPLICLYPIADPISPALLLKCITKISFPSGLDFARNLFVSAIDYIRELDINSLK